MFRRIGLVLAVALVAFAAFAPPARSAPASTANAAELARARAIVDRAKAAKKMASDALDLDGTEAAARGLNQALSCRVGKQQCSAVALSMADPSARVGALVGRAARLANDVLQPT
jgi:hypothetical protein